MNSKIVILVIIVLYIQSSVIISKDDFLEHNLNITLNIDNSINKKSVAKDEIFKGTIYGKVEASSDKYFSNSNLECDFIGRSYEGRGFSCGFSTVEDLQGFCYIKNPDGKNTLITSWSCNTTAGLGGEATCAGKLNIIQGVGLFSGVSGFGRINMPLAKAFKSNKQSTPMTIKLKVKHPLSLKKNL